MNKNEIRTITITDKILAARFVLGFLREIGETGELYLKYWDMYMELRFMNYEQNKQKNEKTARSKQTQKAG